MIGRGLLALWLAFAAQSAGAQPLACLPDTGDSAPEGFALAADPDRDTATVELIADDVALWTRTGGPERGGLMAMVNCPRGRLSVLLFLPADRVSEAVDTLRAESPGPGAEMGSQFLALKRQATRRAYDVGGAADNVSEEFGACVCAAAANG